MPLQKIYTIFLSAISLFLLVQNSGCAPLKWEMHTEVNGAMKWPPPPNPTKVLYLGEIKGFKQIGQSFSSLFFGKNVSGDLAEPASVAVGKDGRIAIADKAKKGVHLYIPATGKYKQIYEVNGGQLACPVGVAFDDALNLYISDSILKEIFIIDPDGTYQRKLGPANKNNFERPTGLTFSKDGNTLYVVDTAMHTVNAFDPHDGSLKYTFGQRGENGQELNYPTHIAMGPEGTIYINDTLNFRIQLYNPATGEFISRFGHHGNGSGDFALPKGIGVDEWEIIYVAEPLFDAVQLFDKKGTFLLTLGSQGNSVGEFWMPSGLFIAQDNKLYVCDTYNKRIQMFQLLEFDDNAETAAK